MDKKEWHKLCLEKIPHGEEGSINLTWEEAITWAKILEKKGYAILITSGDVDDEINVRWLYAGDVDNLDYADYQNVVFTNPEYLEGYPDAINEEYGEEESEDDLPIRPEVSE